MDTATSVDTRTNPTEKNTQNTNTDVTIVGGAGHVGFPLGLVFASKDLNVMLYDKNEQALDSIKAGKLPAIEDGAQELLDKALANNKLSFASTADEFPDAGFIIVTIGTPVDEFLNPVHLVFQKCFDELLPHLTSEHTVILRSTVFPGTTDWLGNYFEQNNVQAKIAFCPERIIQGYAVKELPAMPQIVSGVTPDAEKSATELFKLITDDVVIVKPIEAEFAKLFTNAYRYIQFAATNQFYQIADQAGVNYQNVVHAMTKSYERMQGFPGAGFAAGPCLFKDTMQLSAFAQNQFSIGNAAMLVNEGLPLYILEKLKKNYTLKTMTVGLLGMAFKAENDDIRSSLSYKLKKLLKLYAKDVLTTDPFVECDAELENLEAVIAESDVLVHCTPHKQYRDLNFGEKPIIDVWGIF